MPPWVGNHRVAFGSSPGGKDDHIKMTGVLAIPFRVVEFISGLALLRVIKSKIIATRVVAVSFRGLSNECEMGMITGFVMH